MGTAPSARAAASSDSARSVQSVAGLPGRHARPREDEPAGRRRSWRRPRPHWPKCAVRTDAWRRSPASMSISAGDSRASPSLPPNPPTRNAIGGRRGVQRYGPQATGWARTLAFVPASAAARAGWPRWCRRGSGASWLQRVVRGERRPAALAVDRRPRRGRARGGSLPCRTARPSRKPISWWAAGDISISIGPTDGAPRSLAWTSPLEDTFPVHPGPPPHALFAVLASGDPYFYMASASALAGPYRPCDGNCSMFPAAFGLQPCGDRPARLGVAGLQPGVTLHGRPLETHRARCCVPVPASLRSAPMTERLPGPRGGPAAWARGFGRLSTSRCARPWAARVRTCGASRHGRRFRPRSDIDPLNTVAHRHHRGSRARRIRPLTPGLPDALVRTRRPDHQSPGARP